MKKYFTYFGIIVFVAFSFYFTDKISIISLSKNELVKEIKDMQVFYNEKPINAQINTLKSTITPGKYGRKINITESYLNMRDFNKFNENYLVYNLEKPKISLNDNKNLFITGGNPKKRNVSLLVEDKNHLVNYFLSNNIKISIINRNNTKYGNFINAADNETDFKLLNRFVDKDSRFCLKDYSIIKLCKRYNYYLIKASIIMKSTNINMIKSKIKSGSIIVIDKSAQLEDILLLIDEIRFKDLKIVRLSRLISERE